MVSTSHRTATLAVIVAALGYFVDIYDLILFGMVRVASLQDLGVTDPGAIKRHGVYLLDMQMGGMLLGGILWGVLGDKRGRLRVLFGSITLYSVANIANGMVETVDQYAWCRLIAGIGLAGELGAGITLVSEMMARHTRGIGTTVVAAFGLSGGIMAGLVGGAIPGVGVYWRTAYYIGGGMGLALLVLRIGVVESGMFAAAVEKRVTRGNFLALFTRRDRVVKYLAIIAIGVPIWFLVGVLYTFSPELGKAIGLDEPVRAQTALFLVYAGLAVGDLASGLLSHRLRSRRKALAIFLFATAAVIVAYFTIAATSLTAFYIVGALGGIATGYWAVFVSTAAELFGTNLRATVTTTVPNFVRGAVVPMTLGYLALGESFGIAWAAIMVGVIVMVLSFVALWSLRETYGIDLDFHEPD